jgi:four helix bundle protein
MPQHIYSFEKLQLWTEIRILIKLIYQICKLFPKDELLGLTSQIKRAAISVGSNVVEGSARVTNKDKSHFYTIAYSSLMEVLAQIIISKDLNFIENKDYEATRLQIEKCSRMLNALKIAIQPQVG